MNLPNKLTVARLCLTIVFVICFALPFPGCFSVAFGIFLVAALTDYLDGEIARRGNLITDFGKLMDPLADKILTAAAFISLRAFLECLAGIGPLLFLPHEEALNESRECSDFFADKPFRNRR